MENKWGMISPKQPSLSPLPKSRELCGWGVEGLSDGRNGIQCFPMDMTMAIAISTAAADSCIRLASTDRNGKGGGK